jgi:glutamate/tyrosine decarboxylase-like PLP-dependent enzyme
MPWREGRGWSLVYDAPGGHSDTVLAAAARFAQENALSHSAFPSAGRFEAAVVSMVASVVSPAAPAYGIFTAGGTESIMSAVKAYRDAPGARGSEVLAPDTVHPAFGKAAHFLGLRVRLLPVGPSGAVDPEVVRHATGPDTLLIALSAPNFPFGVLDPIEEVAAGAAERGVPVHVDAALGGLFLPFLGAAGLPAPSFGLDVPGVTSVSVDLHKYGYGAKGASVLLFDAPELRHAAYYVSSGWPGGAYASSGLLGTRSVGAAAGAFASMLALGREGYGRLVREVMATTEALRGGLVDSGAFAVIGAPAMSVFAVTSEQVALPAVVHGLQTRGWRIDAQHVPPAIHFSVFPRHASVVEAFLADAAASVREAERGGVGGDMSSYGVMVRGGGTSEDALREHLDRRFDDVGWWTDEQRICW